MADSNGLALDGGEDTGFETECAQLFARRIGLLPGGKRSDLDARLDQRRQAGLLELGAEFLGVGEVVEIML
jgi:hypothetical protein